MYKNYEDKKLGLYYEVIISHFSVMEYDERFGASAIAVTPWNLLILPFQWITIFPLNDELLKKVNLFLCKILYFPVAIILTIVFSLTTFFIIPLAYVSHLIALTGTLLDKDETMDDVAEKINRVKTILKFALLGPWFLLVAVPVDTYVFWINLYTKSFDADIVKIPRLLTESTFKIMVEEIHKAIETAKSE